MDREVGVISVYRKRNVAYCYIQQNEPFYWATNSEVDLEWIEKTFGCTFVDGDLPHIVMIHLRDDLGDELEVPYVFYY